MTYHWTIPLIAAIASLALGVLVFRFGPRNSTSRVLIALEMVLACWNLNFFVLYSVGNEDLAFQMTRVLRSVAVFLPAVILHLAGCISRQGGRRWNLVLGVDYAISLVLLVANLLDLLVVDLGRNAWGFHSIGGPLYDVFSLSVLGNFLGSTALMFYWYRRSTEPRMRLQLKFWLLGSGIAFPLGLTNLLPAYGLPVYPLGSLGSVLWAGVVTYAIIRHRLMDIDLVLTKGGSYAIVSLVLIVPAFILTLWLQRLSFGQIHTDFSFAVLLMFLAIGVLFPSLRLRTQLRLERRFFPEKQEHRGVMANFTRTIVGILEPDRLLTSLKDTLDQAFDVDRLAVGLRSDGSATLVVSATVGIPPAIEEIAAEHPLAESLSRRGDAVLRDELEASNDVRERSQAAELCRANGWEVAVPMIAGGRLIGFIALGRKLNLTPFYVEELAMLSTVAAEASVAIENARLHEELKRSQDIIRRADRLSALGTLAAGIAHEIRNPLVSIQTFFQLAPQRLHDQEFLTEFLSLTSNEVKRITDLITELLSFARSPVPTTTDVDLNSLVDGVARLIEPQLRKGQIDVVREFAVALPSSRGDRDQLKQVVLNLLLNAVQAMEGGGTIRLTTRAVALRGVRYCQIQIADSGPGIAPQIIDEIFNPFFTTKDKGTGLGLAISNQIVTEHGGFITVESKMDVGTTFRVHLRAGAEETAWPVQDAADDSSLRQASGMRPRYR